MALERIEVKNPVGINTSYVSGDLPLEVWSDGNNIRFKNGKTSKVDGMAPIFESPEGIIGVLPYLRENTPYWLLGSETGIYRTEGGPPVNVSRTIGGPYNANEDFPWNGGILHKVAIWNNGIDEPQALLPTMSNFENLPFWPANTQAKIIRPFKNYLIALNVTKTSVEYPTMVKWSSPADPGSIPFSWDETDPTNDAGETSMADTPGAIVDGTKLRDSFIIYKEDSVYSMRYIGGVYVFSFQQLFNDVGMLAPNCAAEFDGFHFVVGIGDVYVHNGVQKRSVIDGKNREFLFSTIDPAAYKRTFVIPDYNKTEMWICYPSSGDPTGYCNKALVWNWKEDTWSRRDLPDVFCGAVGIVDPKTPDNWDSDTFPWDSDTTPWGSASYNPTKNNIVLSSVLNSKLFVVSDVSLVDGQPYECYLERTGIYLGDNRNLKTVSAVIPHMQGNGLCRVYVGTSKTQDGPIEWKGPVPFNIETDYKVDIKKVGRYVSIRFEFPSEGAWFMNGYTVELAPNAGMR